MFWLQAHCQCQIYPSLSPAVSQHSHHRYLVRCPQQELQVTYHSTNSPQLVCQPPCLQSHQRTALVLSMMLHHQPVEGLVPRLPRPGRGNQSVMKKRLALVLRWTLYKPMCLFRFHGMVQQALAFCAYHVPPLQEDLFSGASWQFKRSELLCSELSPVSF